MLSSLGQLLACLADRHAGPAGSGADVGDRRVQGVLPEVVGLPPGDLIEQVRFGPAVDGRCGQHCVLELLVLPAAEGALGQELLTRSRQGQRVGAAGPAPGQRIRGEAEELLAGEGVVSRVQGRKLALQPEDVSVAGQPVEQDTAGSDGVFGLGRFLAGMLRRTVRQVLAPGPDALPARPRRASNQRAHRPPDADHGHRTAPSCRADARLPRLCGLPQGQGQISGLPPAGQPGRAAALAAQHLGQLAATAWISVRRGRGEPAADVSRNTPDRGTLRADPRDFVRAF